MSQKMFEHVETQVQQILSDIGRHGGYKLEYTGGTNGLSIFTCRARQCCHV